MPEAGRTVPGLVLAAGPSTRMGRNKLLVEVGGRAMVVRVVEALLGSGAVGPLLVAVGFEQEAVRAALSGHADRIEWVESPRWRMGRTETLRAGLSNLAAGAEGILVSPGDLPLLTPALVQALVARFRETRRVVFPLFRGRKGHPVIFPASAFPLLRGLSGEETLHDRLLADRTLADPLPLGDEGCVLDVDTPEELERLLGPRR